MLEYIIHSVALAAMIIGSGTDIDRREVPDWLNFSLIITGLGVRLIYSLVTWSYEPILAGVLGLAAFVGLAYLMFYTGQWGGGDSKMLMGLGALIGLEFSMDSFMIAFIISVLLMGALYGVAWTLVVSIINRKAFKREVRKILEKPQIRKHRRWVAFAAVSLLLVGLALGLNVFGVMLVFLSVAIAGTYYLWIFIKSVERSCMFKQVPPEKLVEGDWIVKDIVIDGKRICGPKDLGIEKEQIEKLKLLAKKKKIKTVLVKEGIPFVPSFLMAYILALFVGNPLGFLFSGFGL